MTSRERSDGKLFAVLLVAGLTGVVASLPLAFEMVERFVPEAEQREIVAQLPLPIPLLILAGLIQNTAVFGAAIAIGMALAPRLGTGAPLVSASLHGRPQPAWRPLLLGPLAAGLILGVMLALVDAAVFLPYSPAALRDFALEVPLWKRLLAGMLYGGMTEELLMRWFLLSLAAWLLGKVWSTGAGRPAAGAWWAANLVVAVLFGVGHLPATQAIVPLSAVVVARALVLNGAASLTFGYLFWRRGLEAAMVAHAAAHIGLQILGPALAEVAPRAG